MLSRLTKYLGEKPRRAALIVMTLITILILVVAGSLFQLLSLGSYLGPPYPSESTPLSLVDDGIKFSISFSLESWTYNKTEFYWSNGTSGVSGPVASDDQQADLSSGSSVTVVHPFAQEPDLSYWTLTIYDSAGDGRPGSGDYIIFKRPLHHNDVVYTIALAYIGGPSGGFAGAEFDYAIHDGELYSWESDMDRTMPPWWYSFRIEEIW